MDPEKTAETPAPAPEPTTPPTPPQQVGAALSATRQSRGYSLESVSQHTRIPRRFLDALEGGRFDELPAPVYLRSFLSDYCDYLELDVRPLWEKLHPAPVVSAPEPAPVPAAKPGKAAAAPAAPARPAQAKPQIVETPPQLTAIISASGGVLLSVALAVALVWWASSAHRLKPAEEESAQAPVFLAARPPAEPRLDIVFHDEAWVSVKADGLLLFAGRAPKDARQGWKAHKSLWLNTSAPESLELTLNGAPYRLQRPDESGGYRIAQ